MEINKSVKLSKEKYKNKTLIIGLGYVGLTLSIAMAKNKEKVWGYDQNVKLRKNLQNFKSHIFEKNINLLLRQNLNKNFFITDKISGEFNNYIITVGTPLKNKKSNLKYIKEVVLSLSKVIKNKPLIIFRSTLPIGTCRNVIIPIFRKKNKIVGKDFDLSFAPERTIEGDAINELENLPQIISGYNKNAITRSEKIFKKLTRTIIKTKNLETAEIIKLINNSYRDLSFAYSNQIALICNNYNLSTNEVINASNFKYPRNVIPKPSPGVGGPCLSKDPYILAENLKDKNNIFTIGRKINNQIVLELIKTANKHLNKKSLVLLCGLSFKGYPETKDYRGSATIMFLKKIKSKKTMILDPLFSFDELKAIKLKPLEKKTKKLDMVIIMNNNKFFKSHSFIMFLNKNLKKNAIVYDYWDMLNRKKIRKDIFCLNIGQYL